MCNENPQDILFATISQVFFHWWVIFIFLTLVSLTNCATKKEGYREVEPQGDGQQKFLAYPLSICSVNGKLYTHQYF